MPRESLVGQTIAGYSLQSEVGEGGTSAVFRAQHADHGTVAVKVLRDKLRQAITVRGLGDPLDQRYRLVIAHMTIVRFAVPLRAPERFVAALEETRSTDFGSTHVEQLELVFGDWFHTQAREQVIRNFELR